MLKLYDKVNEQQVTCKTMKSHRRRRAKREAFMFIKHLPLIICLNIQIFMEMNIIANLINEDSYLEQILLLLLIFLTLTFLEDH